MSPLPTRCASLAQNPPRTNKREQRKKKIDSFQVRQNEAAPALTLIKDDCAGIVSFGNIYTFSFTVANSGSAAATNVTISDNFPEAYSVVEVSSSCTFTTPSRMDCSFPSLAANSTITAFVRYTLSSRDVAPGTIVTNCAVVTSAQTEQDFSDNIDCDMNLVAGFVDLILVKDDCVSEVAPGSTSTFTFTLSNNGTANAVDALVTDSFPAEYIIVSMSSNCQAVDNTVTCLWPAVMTGSNVSAFVVYTVRASISALVVTNCATASQRNASAESSALNGNNQDCDTNRISGSTPILSLVKDDCVDVVSPGAVYNFNFTVMNRGSVGVTNVIVSDFFPLSYSLLSVSSPCVILASRNISCFWSSIAANSSVSAFVRYSLSSAAVNNTRVSNCAFLTSAPAEPLSLQGDNEDCDTNLIFIPSQSVCVPYGGDCSTLNACCSPLRCLRHASSCFSPGERFRCGFPGGSSSN